MPQAKPTQPVPAGFPQPTNRFPFSQSGFAALGRLTLVWREEADRRVLELFDPWEQRTMWPPRKFSNKAKTCLVGDEAVGVLEPDGHFVLLALPGGHVLVDTKLEPEESLAEIILLRSGEQYLLVTHSPKQAAVANRLPIQPMYGTLYKPISHGRVYAFDLDGKPTWAEPVTIDNQHLLLDQPDRVPVLTFACQTYERKPTNNMRYTVSIVCVDKRSGRKVYEGRIAARSTNTMEIVGDPNKHTVELRMRYNAVTLTFTDEPIPPPSAEEVPRDDQPPEPARIARGLLQALGKAVGKAPPRSSDSADKPPREPPPPAPPPPAPPPVEK